MKSHDIPDPGRRQDVMHPSEMAKADWCHRHTYLRLAGKIPYSDGSFSFTLQNIFAEGNFIHEKWQTWLQQTGQLWGDWYCDRCMATVRRTADPEMGLRECGGGLRHRWQYKEVTLFSNKYNVHGHEDGALVNANCLVEFKSVGMGTLRFEQPELLSRHYNHSTKQYDLDAIWKDIKRPFPSHVRQVNIYMWLAQEMGLPFNKTAVVYEYKVNQQAKEFLVQYSPELVAPILTKILQVNDAMKTGVEPACVFDKCKYCGPYDKKEAAAAAGPHGDAGGSDPAPPRVVRVRGRRDDGGRRDDVGQAADGHGADQAAVETDAEGAGS